MDAPTPRSISCASCRCRTCTDRFSPPSSSPASAPACRSDGSRAPAGPRFARASMVCAARPRPRAGERRTRDQAGRSIDVELATELEEAAVVRIGIVERVRQLARDRDRLARQLLAGVPAGRGDRLACLRAQRCVPEADDRQRHRRVHQVTHVACGGQALLRHRHEWLADARRAPPPAHGQARAAESDEHGGEGQPPLLEVGDVSRHVVARPHRRHSHWCPIAQKSFQRA